MGGSILRDERENTPAELVVLIKGARTGEKFCVEFHLEFENIPSRSFDVICN